jgi:hypothetical protein
MKKQKRYRKNLHFWMGFWFDFRQDSKNWRFSIIFYVREWGFVSQVKSTFFYAKIIGKKCANFVPNHNPNLLISPDISTSFLDFSRVLGSI